MRTWTLLLSTRQWLQIVAIGRYLHLALSSRLHPSSAAAPSSSAEWSYLLFLFPPTAIKSENTQITALRLWMDPEGDHACKQFKWGSNQGEEVKIEQQSTITTSLWLTCTGEFLRAFLQRINKCAFRMCNRPRRRNASSHCRNMMIERQGGSQAHPESTAGMQYATGCSHAEENQQAASHPFFSL